MLLTLLLMRMSSPSASASASASEHVAENVPERVAPAERTSPAAALIKLEPHSRMSEPTSTESASAARMPAGLLVPQSLRAVLVVHASLLRIRQRLVRFGDLREVFGRSALIWVMLQRLNAIVLLQRASASSWRRRMTTINCSASIATRTNAR